MKTKNVSTTEKGSDLSSLVLKKSDKSEPFKAHGILLAMDGGLKEEEIKSNQEKDFALLFETYGVMVSKRSNEICYKFVNFRTAQVVVITQKEQETSENPHASVVPKEKKEKSPFLKFIEQLQLNKPKFFHFNKKDLIRKDSGDTKYEGRSNNEYLLCEGSMKDGNTDLPKEKLYRPFIDKGKVKLIVDTEIPTHMVNDLRLLSNASRRGLYVLLTENDTEVYYELVGTLKTLEFELPNTVYSSELTYNLFSAEAMRLSGGMVFFTAYEVIIQKNYVEVRGNVNDEGQYEIELTRI